MVDGNVQNDSPQGLTHNWNHMYAYFKHHSQYTTLFFINNDLLFANDTFTRMAKVLHVHVLQRVERVMTSTTTTLVRANRCWRRSTVLPWSAP